MTYTVIAAQFTNHYYKTFDEAREQLRSLYRPHSMLTFESTAVCGEDNILQTTHRIGKVVHTIVTFDAQPCGNDGRILVMVTGHMVIDGSEHPQGFSECFQLIPENGTYYILNDIFKLVYPA
ncbi:NTF2-like protein [Terfezia boudieri ATCC MYA-4762]|uniref:Nuclear transport factor 2 n=1 Tax=Terfezia boudieri ATCC MYA-4762 TaxID=1051890 RepID=A0A3N4LI30_9PEZI|nr:NTF2-like protein [Terfezia boudieri ATCC MYA-4762]